MKMRVFGLSDIGISRQRNEDVWIALPEIGFFALADGMGGHKAGDVAAAKAIEHLSDLIQKVKTEDPLELLIQLRQAIESANQSIYKIGKEEETLYGMGTTLCCLVWSESAVIYAHVGDSRIYRMRGKKLTLLTQDHSLYMKWKKTGLKSQTPYPYKNVITRALGISSKVDPEIAISTYLETDCFFLCSDGLSDVLSLSEIEKIINESPSLEIASKNLIETAKNKGSSDNITVLMMELDCEKDLPRQQCNDSPCSGGLGDDAKRSFGDSFEPLERSLVRKTS